MGDSDSDSSAESLNADQIEQMRRQEGTLQKKNSLYFKKEFQLDFKEQNDLRTTVTNKLKSATLKRGGNMRQTSIFSISSNKKNSIYKKGTLEHRLNSMMDLAHTEFQDNGPDEEEYEKQKEQHNQDKQYYSALNTSKVFKRYHDKCKRKAKHNLDNFYKTAEKELEEIETIFGLDEKSLKEIEIEVRAQVDARNAAEEKEKAKESTEKVKDEEKKVNEIEVVENTSAQIKKEV